MFAGCLNESYNKKVEQATILNEKLSPGQTERGNGLLKIDLFWLCYVVRADSSVGGPKITVAEWTSASLMTTGRHRWTGKPQLTNDDKQGASYLGEKSSHNYHVCYSYQDFFLKNKSMISLTFKGEVWTQTM